MNISDSILYTGVNDHELDLFEGQYDIHDGISYNSYVILDEKTAILDSVDARKTAEWVSNLDQALSGRKPAYFIVSHIEPDHGGSLRAAADKFPDMQFVMSAKAMSMLAQFGYVDLAARTLAVKENDTLSLGAHTLRFFMAPMVHWPEVMVTYEETGKTLFSADAFGKFGALDEEDEDWLDEAREYYINIVGKYGGPVQTLLKKAAALDVRRICPLHGPVLSENLGYYLDKYNTWSSYQPEEKGVLIAYGTLHGNTAVAAKKLAEMLREKGVSVEVTDLARDILSESVSKAFKYDTVVLASPTYDGGIFPRMEEFISHLKAKAFQKRRIAFIENGSWAPMAAKNMKNLLEGCKDLTFCETVVTIKSTVSDANIAQLEKLAEELKA
ncbi:MAG: FprA family A-type flavoprotein [Clostridiales bacterium]|nr:FprA family A-type flavoprotein [Clostridiales bacterium]